MSPLRLGKPRAASQNPVHEAGFLRLSSEFGGKSGANSTELIGPRRTSRHRVADLHHPKTDVAAHNVISFPIMPHSHSGPCRTYVEVGRRRIGVIRCPATRPLKAWSGISLSRSQV